MNAPLASGGSLNGARIVGKDTLARMGRVASATHEDVTLVVPSRFSLGYMKSMDNRRLAGVDGASCLISDAALGHVGAGGSIGFACPETRMSFGYNQMGLGLLLNNRGQSLIDEAYAIAGADFGGAAFARVGLEGQKVAQEQMRGRGRVGPRLDGEARLQ